MVLDGCKLGEPFNRLKKMNVFRLPGVGWG